MSDKGKPVKLTIVKAPAKILRAICRPIDKFDGNLRSLAAGMFDLLNRETNPKGIGLAANQVGQAVRLITIHVPGFHPVAMCNPEIEWAKGEDNGLEMCLSEPGAKVWIKRASKIKVKYQDLDGNPQSLTARDLFARCIQHELDHLEGRLISDYLADGYEPR